jgi:hypothetical protein
MTDDQAPRPFGRIVSDGLQHLSSLVSLDLRLFQAEMKQKLNHIIASGVLGFAALGCFLLGGFALAECLIFFLIWLGLQALWAAMIIGVGLCLLGFISLHLARRTLAGWTLVPEQTLVQMQGDLIAVKEGFRHVSS